MATAEGRGPQLHAQSAGSWSSMSLSACFLRGALNTCRSWGAQLGLLVTLFRKSLKLKSAEAWHNRFLTLCPLYLCLCCPVRQDMGHRCGLGIGGPRWWPEVLIKKWAEVGWPEGISPGPGVVTDRPAWGRMPGYRCPRAGNRRRGRGIRARPSSSWLWPDRGVGSAEVPCSAH